VEVNPPLVILVNGDHYGDAVVTIIKFCTVIGSSAKNTGSLLSASVDCVKTLIIYSPGVVGAWKVQIKLPSLVFLLMVLVSFNDTVNIGCAALLSPRVLRDITEKVTLLNKLNVKNTELGAAFESQREYVYVVKQIAYQNERLKALKMVNRTAEQYLNELKKQVEEMENVALAGDYFVNKLSAKKEKNDYLIEMYDSIQLLTEHTAKLAAIEERSNLAKEIHDILGHAMILALSIMESNRVIIIDNPMKAFERLKQAIIEIDEGFQEINENSPCKTNEAKHSFDRFYKGLKLMADKTRNAGVLVELVAVDNLNGCKGSIFDGIYRLCQEAVTNSIKHGRASYIMISIRKTDNTITIHIVDNGLGCISLLKGNGIMGMEERMKKFGGHVAFKGFDDQKGFLVQASIPVKTSY
jgi:signal transduction histidine kinase